jgi:DNA-binding transcriptional MerR regulator
MESYLTCGQVAKKLHISISTLKRWACEPSLGMKELRNHNGWRLFSEEQVIELKEFKRQLRRNGKRFNHETLMPIDAEKKEPVLEASHN